MDNLKNPNIKLLMLAVDQLGELSDEISQAGVSMINGVIEKIAQSKTT